MRDTSIINKRGLEKTSPQYLNKTRDTLKKATNYFVNLKNKTIFVVRYNHKGGVTRLTKGRDFLFSSFLYNGLVPPCDALMRSLPLWCIATGQAKPYFFSHLFNNYLKICNMRYTETLSTRMNNSSTRTPIPKAEKTAKTISYYLSKTRDTLKKATNYFVNLKNRLIFVLFNAKEQRSLTGVVFFLCRKYRLSNPTICLMPPVDVKCSLARTGGDSLSLLKFLPLNKLQIKMPKNVILSTEANNSTFCTPTPPKSEKTALTNQELKEILTTLPTLYMDVDNWDWEDNDYERGRYRNPDYEIDLTGGVLIRCELLVEQVAKVTPATYYQPAESTLVNQEIEIENLELYNPDGELVELTPRQEEKIVQTITNNVAL